MVTAVQAAALIAAISFAVLAGAGVYVLLKTARLITEASRAVADWRTRSDAVLGRANSAVERAYEQLARTNQLTTSMEDVSTSIAEVTADMSVVTGAIRTILGGPLGRLAGFTYGVRRAIALRRRPAARRLPSHAPQLPAAAGQERVTR